MRMEAKNSYFKRVAQIGNFKNIAYSVARRHQRLLCAHLQGEHFFTYDELECGPSAYIKINMHAWIFVNWYNFLGEGDECLQNDVLCDEIRLVANIDPQSRLCRQVAILVAI